MKDYLINTMARNKINTIIFIISIFLGIAINLTVNLIAIKNTDGEIFFILFNILVLPSVYGIYELLRLLMVKFLWKTKIINKLIGIPNLSGDWSIQGKSDYNGETKYKGKFTICQTLDKIKVCGDFSNSISCNNLTCLQIDEDGSFELSFYYENRPKCQAPNTMQIHNGFMIMTKKDNDSMVGEYFTDRFRGNKGDMKLTKVYPKKAEN